MLSSDFDFDFGIFFSPHFFEIDCWYHQATTSSNKRQRTGQEDALLLSDLPDGILAHAASFLASPQKALFALAMTATSDSWEQNNIGSKHQQSAAAILQSEEWDVLDFEDIEKSLAVKLTDDDISALMMCINARDVLKKLKLTGCINITGRGLQVLRGSTTIEHIDLSLVKQYESPKLDPEPMISEEVVLPILDSIVSANGSSLKLIVFPKKWRTAKNTELAEFLVRYNQLLDRRVPKCTKCTNAFEAETREWDMAVSDINDSNLFGKQSYCCYKCTKHFCYHNNCTSGGRMDCCELCEKEYCVDCTLVSLCDKCSRSRCNGCSSSGVETCQNCFEDFCSDCAPENTADICACANAETVYCSSCFPEASQCIKKGCNKVHCADCELCDDPEGEEE